MRRLQLRNRLDTPLQKLIFSCQNDASNAHATLIMRKAGTRRLPGMWLVTVARRTCAHPAKISFAFAKAQLSATQRRAACAARSCSQNFLGNDAGS